MLRDLEYALRMFVKAPGFTLVAVLSLALGTGANSAIFSFVDALLLRPLPVENPGGVFTIVSRGGTAPDALAGMSYREYVDIRDSAKNLDDLVAVSYIRLSFGRVSGAVPKVKYGLIVSGNLFRAMGVAPALGRAFRPEEDQVVERDAVVVLGYDFWRAEFNSDPAAVGQIVHINGTAFTVIGVAPATFTGLDSYLKSAMFLPAMMIPKLSPNSVGPYDMLQNRDYRAFAVKGRLKNGASVSQAQAELAGIAQNMAQSFPHTNAGRTFALETEVARRREMFPNESGLMAMLMLMAGLVLVVSCFNVANLLLSRARSRTREVAVRLALGAGRVRMIRQLLTESLLLGLAGSAAGLWLAWLSLLFIRELKVPSDLPFMTDFHIDHRALWFSLAAATASVLLFGLAPALQSTRVDLVPALKASGAGDSGRRRWWGRNLLVIGQVAISLVLLLVAATLYRSFRAQLLAGAGFRTSHLMMMGFDPKLLNYSDEQTRDFYRRLVDQASRAPGVKSAALTQVVPLSIIQRMTGTDLTPEGYSTAQGRGSLRVLCSSVDEGYFDTMGTPIIAGRGFRNTDKEGAPKVAIVNEAFASAYWPSEGPTGAIGKRLLLDDGKTWVQVVGVARTSKYVLISEPPAAFVYFSLHQRLIRSQTLVASSYGESASVAEPLRQVVRGLDPNMPILDMRTMEDFFDSGAVGQFRIVMDMVGIMGLTALTLAMVGLYGLVSYSVSRRTREFGIRMAIGADRSNVLWMVLRQGLAMAAFGVMLGAIATRPVASLLQSVVAGATSDWIPYAIVPLLLFAVTGLASYGPARRASRVDPMRALREE